MEEIWKAEIVPVVIKSTYLKRDVMLSIILPPGYKQKPYPVLWLNDGQDIPSLQLLPTLEKMYLTNTIFPHIVIGIHANEQRLQEYGTLEMADYNKRGNKAGYYTEFVINELLPFIQAKYYVSKDPLKNCVAGFSLGALSAIDIAWNNPEYFLKVGVFSGSLWWRKRALNRWYKDDRDRIIHQVIRNSEKREGMRFWFQAGTNDEPGDRNKNGVIDSIDDTIDLIKELKYKGYTDHNDIEFVLVKNGEHNQGTWGEMMPQFLQWAFPKAKAEV
ncbi:MAG: alpha/beta hydrolase-fold protein [Chitinophagales bacterium]